MNFNSIKLRLQLWYGLLLLAVIVGLGLAAFKLESDKMYRQIDAEIGQRIRVLAAAVNGSPREISQNFSGQAPPSRESFRLAPRDEALFGVVVTQGFYYVVTAQDGQEIARSTNAPQLSETNKLTTQRTREIITPTDERIFVGRSIAADLSELHRTALKLATIGAVILLLGLSGGWFLVSRALRPISDITMAAEKISTGDLTQRINVAQTKSELGQLATVLNAMFTRLEAAFTQQRRFSADAAHELRTPVSVLIAQTHAALIRPRSYEENLATIEACHRAAQRMRRLIVSLLQLARLDAEPGNMPRAEFDLALVADECVELVQPLADERGVKIISEITAAKMSGDADQIGQVITNLVTNAIQYNRPGGAVRVSLRSEKTHALLSVADHGVGIAAADLPHIFERFYRADAARASGNAGLGLAISQAIVTAHGGTIEVSSQENVGTTFSVHWPLA